jgi:hypothetical protein
MSDGVKVVANVEIGLLLGLERQLADDRHAIAWAATKTYCEHKVHRQHPPSMLELLVTVVVLGRSGWLGY